MTRERFIDLFGPATVIAALVTPFVIGLLCLLGY
jgi:hypothetical protein